MHCIGLLQSTYYRFENRTSYQMFKDAASVFVDTFLCWFHNQVWFICIHCFSTWVTMSLFFKHIFSVCNDLTHFFHCCCSAAAVCMIVTSMMVSGWHARYFDQCIPSQRHLYFTKLTRFNNRAGDRRYHIAICCLSEFVLSND